MSEKSTAANPKSPAQPKLAATAGTSAATTAAVALLKLESDIRKTRSPAELAYFIANEVRILTRAQQIAVLTRTPTGRLTVTAVTAVTMVDRSAPLVIWIEAVVSALERRHVAAATREFDATAFQEEVGDFGVGYPLRNLLWTPFLDFDGAVIGGMLQARTAPWSEHEITIGKHVAGAAAHASLAISPSSRGIGRHFKVSRRSAAIAGIVLAALAFLPVSMSALAPVEAVPRNPFVVTAGVDGVIEAVHVDPNARVSQDTLLVKIVDTVLRNRLEVAEREVLVAEAKQKKAAQLAFVDTRGRHDLALAQAELALKLTERDFAKELMARAEIKADREGIAFFADKKDLVGRPVAAGEKLMEIADPHAVTFRIDLPVAEAIVLKDGARAKIFLDSDPLRPVEARLVRADYQARVRDGQPLAFRLVAEATDAAAVPARLGVRGTAQVYSHRVPLAYYLFRRPIAAARQWAGI